MKDISFQNKLKEILASQSIDSLTEFENSKHWEHMTEEQREALGKLFVKRGENQLHTGDIQVFKSFELALQVTSNNPQIFYMQGLAYASNKNNGRCLNLAVQSFQRAADHKLNLFDLWLSWANVLTQLGTFHHDFTYFHEAHQKYIEAEKLSRHLDANALLTLYWCWGKCWHQLGKHSGEAFDYSISLEKYRSAKKGEAAAEFWNDYGDVINEFAHLINSKEMLQESIECYRKAILQKPDFYQGWMNLGYCFARLFDLTNDEKYFHCADESFTKTVKYEFQDSKLWLKWALLYSNYGKLNSDLKKLQASLDKFATADLCDANNPAILSHWGEAEMLCGAHLERIDLLRSSEEKLLKSLEIDPENSETWLFYGTCLNELGRYFDDEKYYLKAIEKLQYGITLNQSDSMLWYGLAIANHALGELRNDISFIEKGIQYFSRVHEFSGINMGAQFWNDWGVSLMKIAELTNDKYFVLEALEKFEHALEIQSKEADEKVEPEWLYNYGCALDFLGDFDEDGELYEKAVQVLSKALQIDPEYSNARYNLALALSHLGEVAADIDSLHKSIEHFQILLNKDAEDEMGWNDWGLTLLNLAVLVHDHACPQQSQEYYAQAEQKLFHAVALGCIHSYYNLACLYSLTGNYAAAIQFIERAENAGALPPIEDVMHDDWLEGLRRTNSFRHFISQLSSKQENDK